MLISQFSGCQIDAEGKELKWAKLGKKQVWHHPACFVQRKDELKIESGLTADILDVSLLVTIQ